jgi:hypothetical protein
MPPQVILIAVAGLLTAISKLISAGEDRRMQGEALFEAEEALKKALDHYKFGVPPSPSTMPERLAEDDYED